MEQWKNRVAIVTGASTGIGASIAKCLVTAGMITIGLSRRLKEIENQKKDLPANVHKNFHAMKCDVTDEEEIVKVFSQIDSQFNGIDVLINNAGIGQETELIATDSSALIRKVMDTNVFGLVFCTREAYKSMKNHGRNSHIVHINSLCGHRVIRTPQMPSCNMYTPSKHAVTAITEIHRQEFIRSKHHIKVTSISPGAVKTNTARHRSYTTAYPDMPFLSPEDIAHSVLHVLGTPPHVQIHELTIKPFGEFF